MDSQHRVAVKPATAGRADSPEPRPEGAGDKPSGRRPRPAPEGLNNPPAPGEGSKDFTRHMDGKWLARMVETTRPGWAFVYHRGFLCADMAEARGDERRRLVSLQRAAAEARDAGRVELFQQRSARPGGGCDYWCRVLDVAAGGER